MKLNVLLISLIIFLNYFELEAQQRFKTVRDTTKYNERSMDVKVFRGFNNINSGFINTLINITNKSIVPVSIVTPIGMYITAKMNKDQYDESSAVLLAMTEVTNEIFTQGIKYLTKRNRPYITLNDVNFTDTNSVSGTYSFPSGHVSGSFAIATSLTLRYPDKPLLIAGLYSYAVIVSLGRIYWGVHYPSDVLGGMIVGAGSAALIYAFRSPIIKTKNNLFNQSSRMEDQTGSVNSSVLFISLAVTDLINFFKSKSENLLFKNSSISFNAYGKMNYLNYNYNF